MKKQSGFTLIELLIVIALIGILSAIGIPAYTGYQAKARYNAAKTNHVNARNYIMAEISKCNDKTTAISFIDKNAVTQTIAACPTTPAGAQDYFTRYLKDKFANPYITTALDITAVTPLGGVTDGKTWGYMVLATTATGVSLTTGLGNVDGSKSLAGETRIEQISTSD